MLLPPTINCCSDSFLQYQANNSSYKCLRCNKVFIYQRQKLSLCCSSNITLFSKDKYKCISCSKLFDKRYIVNKKKWVEKKD